VGSRLVARDGMEDVAKSDWVCLIMGRYLLRSRIGLFDCCCACTAAAACFNSDDDESELWSIASDMLLFLRMGFLLMNELLFERRLVGSEACWEYDRFDAGWRGP
jgi:hypothetical protein